MYIVTQKGKDLEKVVVCKTPERLKSVMNETIENGCSVLYKFNHYNLCINLEELVRLNVLEKSDIQQEKFGPPVRSESPVRFGINEALDKLVFNDNQSYDFLENKLKIQKYLRKKRHELNNKVKKFESDIKKQTLLKNKFKNLYNNLTNTTEMENSYEFHKSFNKIKKDIEELDKDIE